MIDIGDDIEDIDYELGGMKSIYNVKCVVRKVFDMYM